LVDGPACIVISPWCDGGTHPSDVERCVKVDVGCVLDRGDGGFVVVLDEFRVLVCVWPLKTPAIVAGEKRRTIELKSAVGLLVELVPPLGTWPMIQTRWSIFSEAPSSLMRNLNAGVVGVEVVEVVEDVRGVVEVCVDAYDFEALLRVDGICTVVS